MAMTQQQRSDAARKAAASRRANQANGTTASAAPKSSRAQVNAYKATPVPTYKGAKLVALSAIEDAFVLKARAQGITDEMREAFAKYKKLKALALGPVVNAASQVEADSALRMAIVFLVKLAF